MKRNNDLVVINLVSLFAALISLVLPFWSVVRTDEKYSKYYAGALQVKICIL